MGYRVTHYFQREGYRWTDTYYSEQTSAQAAAEAFQPYRVAMLNLMDNLAKMEKVVAVNDNGDGRDSYPMKIERAGVVESQGGGFETTPDVPSTAFHIIAFTDGGRRRNIYVSGLTDTAVKYRNDGTVDITADYRERCNDLIDGLVDSGARLRITTPPATGGAFAWQLVKSFAAEEGTDDRYTVHTLAAAHLIQPGDVVQFKVDAGNPLHLPYRGRHKVVSIGPDGGPIVNLTVQAQYLGSAAKTNPDEMYLRKIGFAYQAFVKDKGGFWAFTTRKRGESGTKKGRAKGYSFRH